MILPVTVHQKEAPPRDGLRMVAVAVEIVTPDGQTHMVQQVVVWHEADELPGVIGEVASWT